MDYLKGIWDLRRKGSRGFTLVELLVVIAIIGVLATLVLLQLGTARARARDTKRIADIAQYRSAIEQYYEDNAGAYPAALSDTASYFSSGAIPTDPLNNGTYNYVYCVNGLKYQVSAELEQKAAALNADSDLTDALIGVAGCRDGSVETCAVAGDDCVYDQGTQ